MKEKLIEHLNNLVKNTTQSVEHFKQDLNNDDDRVADYAFWQVTRHEARLREQKLFIRYINMISKNLI